MVGVAVNVTEVPVHTGFASADTETLTGRFDEVTVIVIMFEIAGDPVPHLRFDVNTQLTASELFGV